MASRRMALLAEQDNRVRIPDGTAAVNADDALFDESQSLGIPWEGRAHRSVSQTLQGISQKTYETAFSCIPRVYGMCFVAEKRLRCLIGAAACYF